MKEIVLNTGAIVHVDDEDFASISSFKWTELKNVYTSYATRYSWKDGAQRTVYMHRVITGVGKGFEVDHINGDGLDNRRANLRICTHAQNMRNRRAHRRARQCQFRGVTRHTTASGDIFYIVSIPGPGPREERHATAELAALAYDRAARRAYGEFARLNFPDAVALPTEQFGITNSRSGYRGVQPNAGGFQVMLCGKHVGYFRDVIEAAKAYDEAARKKLGARAKLNFPQALSAAVA